MSIGKVKIHAGFILLVTILVYIDQGYLLWVVFAAALLHELGHYIPLRLLGGRVARLELTGGGVGMETSQPMSYGKELLTVIAGPAASLVFALLFTVFDDMIDGQAALTGMCFSHGVFNLLPMRGLDGGRILEILLDAFGFKRTAANITTIVTAVVLGLVCGFMALRHRNVSMLLAMMYIMSSMFQQKQMQR
ncbi:MAG: M50 family metallopeptidase [Oscillospiraceae bacterium]|nr:M50 family metallopeptidase [Oscillospiraceae bacterium]